MRIKGLVAKLTKDEDFPPRHSSRYYTHDLERLLEIARLSADYDREAARSEQFDENWTVVQEWSEEARYVRCG